jgi:hypothetical protein
MSSDRDTVIFVTGLAVVNNVFWVFRLAAFRRDRDGSGHFFGDLPSPHWEIYNPANYVPGARRTFRMVIISTVILLVAMLAFAIVVPGADTPSGSAPSPSNMLRE